MKPITISRRFKSLNRLLQEARQHNLILQSADGEQFVLARIPNGQATDTSADVQSFEVGASEDFDEEVALTRQNSTLMEFLDERASHKKPGSDATLEDVRRRLG